MRTKCVIDFTEKSIKFNTTDMNSKAGIYIVLCKQCRASAGNAVLIKQDCLIPPRARTVTTVVAENKTFIEDVVCMLVSNPKSYTKEQLLIPNSVNEIKGGKTSVAVSDFGNQPKILIAGSMVGF
jgi:tRNA U34 5-carboxymethylaminomethyl modifying GTPase MnmE/TrmE